jgi:opacity protein-like surface antigen
MPGREFMKRICRMIIALCLPLLLCSPAMAQHSGLYVGGLFGGNALMTSKASDDQGSFSLKFKPGLQGSGVVGWDFEPGNPVGEGRIELEYTRRSNRFEQANFAEGSVNGSGNLTSDSLLLNFFGVFYGDRLWSPYVGAGVGVARFDASDLQVTGQPLSNGTAYVFAYQLGTGVDFQLTTHLSLDLGYRFFGSIRPKFTEANGHNFTMDYFSHNVVLGLRVGF